MGAIVDTVFLGTEEIAKVKDEYPEAVIRTRTFTATTIQRYLVIIPDHNWFDDDYYQFLLDNHIATSSSAFCSRVESDKKFAERMRALVSFER